MEEMIAKLKLYEVGKLSEEEIINLFQQIVDEKLLIQIGGKYSKVVEKLIAEGKITKEPRPRTVRLLDDIFE